MERASIGRPEMRQSGRGGELAFDQSEEKAVEHDVLKNSHILGLSLSVFLCVCVCACSCICVWPGPAEITPAETGPFSV